jgi:putative nucleotidyltransferase with HDIG domain
MNRYEKKELLTSYYNVHWDHLNRQVLAISLIYLTLSIIWNSVFQWFQLPYSRASMQALLFCAVGWVILYLAHRLFRIRSIILLHIVLLFVIYVVTCLYFGSGYREGWSFYLLVPLIASLYGNTIIISSYSLIGLCLLIFNSIYFPQNIYITDLIDISNRILLYVIIATFSYVLFIKLNELYHRQVNTIVGSMETTIEQVVKSFIIAIEAKDIYTYGHSERVSKYAVALANVIPELQDEKELDHLRLAGLLHDIGKINIPEAILTKPDRLTEIEYEIIKTHPVVGMRMLEKISSLELLKSGVLYHHERWDGLGYPSQIKGKDIPIQARVLAIADAFDAMTSTRAYRNALSFDEAFQILKNGAGTQFDPNLISYIEFIRNSWGEIYEETHDEIRTFEKISEML